MKILILERERNAPRRSNGRQWPWLFVLIALWPSGHDTLAQQPSAGPSKDLITKSAASKQAALPGELPRPRAAVAVESVDTLAILRSARLIFVRSHSILVKGVVVEEKLQKRPEFAQFGLVITRDADAADLVLELRHDLFTKYVFTAVDTRTQTLVASGKLSSLGGTVADKVAKRFLKQVSQARLPSGTGTKD